MRMDNLKTIVVDEVDFLWDGNVLVLDVSVCYGLDGWVGELIDEGYWEWVKFLG